MKYTTEIEIDLPRDKVIELFDSVENLKHWQDGLVTFEPISGTPGEVGSKAKLKYKMGSRDIEMIETITHKDLPREFHGTYEAKGVFNKIENTFEEVGPNKTRWISENEFICTGFMKIFAWLMPGVFKKQSYKYMVDFKNFAENA